MSVDNKEPYFAFEHLDYDGKTIYTRVTAQDRWSDVLEDFVRFLEVIYKYNIKDQVRIKRPVWFDFIDDDDLYDPWANHYFVIDEKEKADEDSSHPGLSD